MTAVAPKPITARPYPARPAAKGSVLLKLMRTTDPKDIGIMYLVTSFAFFMIGGLMALLMRGRAGPAGAAVPVAEQYNQLFTMHGTIMLLFYATPIVFGFANFIVPLQIGAPDVAFPRLNAFSYWLYLFGALIVDVRRSSPRAAPPTSAGPPTRRCPDVVHSPGRRRRPVDHRPGASRSRHDPRRRQHRSPRSSACAPRA